MKKLNIGGRRINLSIWDTAGQERFHALGPIYYRGSNGAILVYDITDEDSFQKVKNWVKELRKMLGAEICLVIAGNKTDLDKDRHVTVEEAETYVVWLFIVYVAKLCWIFLSFFLFNHSPFVVFIKNI